MIGEFEPSERGSAINTLPDNQNAPYRVVSAEFRQSGFTLTQIKRAGNGAIYIQKQWGVKGFTYRTIEAAECKFRELTANAEEVA